MPQGAPTRPRRTTRTANGRRTRDLRTRVGSDVRRLREDAGLSIRRLAAEAWIDDGYLGQVERGEREPSLTVLVALATALGGSAQVRLYPGTGPRLRDPIQARIVEALLRGAHERWVRRVEVPVYRPARGVIDVILQDRETPVVIAVEVHSELRRLEQQLRWAGEKAASLPSADFWSLEPAPSSDIERLMILRSTRTNRLLARRFSETLRAAYPATPADAYRALTEPGVPWPGPALLWATVTGQETRLSPGRPGG